MKLQFITTQHAGDAFEVSVVTTMGLPIFKAYGSTEVEARTTAQRIACAMNRDTFRATVLAAVKQFRAEVLDLSNQSTESLVEFILQHTEKPT